MHDFLTRSDDRLHSALRALDGGEGALRSALEALPSPIYTTDADGMVTFFNSACIGFAGRQPEIGKDRWCVTWKLFTEDGEFLPHDQCPMAAAIASKKPIRGVCAVAQRPDGTGVTFMPFPTPIMDDHGRLTGAVNMLIDITEIRQIADLRGQARRCRRLSNGVGDSLTMETLGSMAAEYDAKADALEMELLLSLA